MIVFGLLRIKNEARWIVDVLRSILPLCDRIFVLDDHSDDGTPELCESLGEGRVSVTRSTFASLDERRDKNLLLEMAMRQMPQQHLLGDERSPCWALAIDGDELLDIDGPQAIWKVLPSTQFHAFKLPIQYLWNSELPPAPGKRQVRVDGVYRTFARPSLFRLMNRSFTYMTTPWGGNLHCSSIPQQLLHHAHHATIAGATLWHLGYNDAADRMRKYRWYNQVDPGNIGENQYIHCIQGDVPDVPASATLKHGGPLRLEMK